MLLNDEGSYPSHGRSPPWKLSLCMEHRVMCRAIVATQAKGRFRCQRRPLTMFLTRVSTPLHPPSITLCIRFRCIHYKVFSTVVSCSSSWWTTARRGRSRVRRTRVPGPFAHS
jgi:hypothetical protein